MNSGMPSVSSNVAARLERLPLSWVHYRLLIIHGFGWFFDALDVGIVTFVLAALGKDWKLSSTQIGLIGSAGLGGMALGAAIAGMVADRWGRKTVFQFTLFVFAIATLLCASAWNTYSMIVFRFLAGMGLGGELPVVCSLLSELVPGKHRGRFIVLLESFWAYGWLAAALIAFLLIPAYGWRIAFIVGAIPAFYIWIVRRTLPESPRWYEINGQIAQAEKVVAAMEKESERRTGLILDALGDESVSESIDPRSSAFADLWTRLYLRRTVMLWILWFGLVFGYYGIFVLASIDACKGRVFYGEFVSICGDNHGSRRSPDTSVRHISLTALVASRS